MEDKRDFLFRFIPAEIRSRLLLDNEALYSVTDQYTANKISKYIKRNIPDISTVMDGTACIGGNTLSFTKFFNSVIAVEIDPTRYAYLCHNMRMFESTNVVIYNASVLDVCQYTTQDMIFIDPPWGGPNYKSRHRINLYLSGVELSIVCRAIAPYTKYIAIKVPTNFDIDTFNARTNDVLTLLFRNTDLRKMHLLIYEAASPAPAPAPAP